MTIKTKICGITNLEDALAATAAGADYLGFIIWPHSKRAITVEATGQIVAHLQKQPRRPLLVGVFVDEDAEQVASILDQTGLDLAQLSGDEPPAFAGDPASPLYGRSYKALRPTSFAEAEAEAEWFVPPERSPGQPALLLDTYHPTLRGGTGQVTDWAMAARLAALVPGLMLAGGLNPDNVAQAVQQVRPFAVDVASGVEAAPGRKDHALLRAFIARAKNAGTAG